ncbi:MAG: alkaline phosphatase family protein [Pseudomonadota bacterium]
MTNVLWIMADQLRYDYLSCYGADFIDTPNIDRLAKRGVRFDRAYVQSPVCGPSRMSFYTGRYMRSHGATWNGFPLRVGEPTLGDHLRAAGARPVLVGKTHMMPDHEGMARLGIDAETAVGRIIAQCGFEAVVRDDGLHPDGYYDVAEAYDAYLRAHGMDGLNPWEEWANSAVNEAGEVVSGWFLENAHLPARVPKEHSETAWLTDRGIDFIEGAGDQPWLCHLSYIKPHWPYLAPAPYHDMYGPDDLPPPVRSEAERETDHPLMQAWLDMRVSKSFSRDAVRDRIGPCYLGLIKQLDDELGRLFDYLDASGRMADTMIVVTSDHGDNLGDHWLGEKDLFYDCSARIPLIVYDPRPEADATRGTVNDALVEGIDLAPTFMAAMGAPAHPHVIEGRDLTPLLHGQAVEWRRYAFSEYDYATREARDALGIDQAEARLTMVFDGRWKYVHAEGFRPLLWDLETDPDEVDEVGADPAHAGEIARLEAAHFAWSRQHHTRITRSAEIVEKMTAGKEPPGILIGYWDPAEAREDDRQVPRHI